jgi:hypothetical protein
MFQGLLSRFSLQGSAAVGIQEKIVPAIRPTGVARMRQNEALYLGPDRSWILPRPPLFLEQGGGGLDRPQGCGEGPRPLVPRLGGRPLQAEHEYAPRAPGDAVGWGCLGWPKPQELDSAQRPKGLPHFGANREGAGT